MAHANYVILSERDIRARQDEAIGTIAGLLKVSAPDAGILLRHFKWSVSKVIDQWFGDEEGVRRSVGLLRPSRPEFQRRTSRRPSQQQDVQCTICLDAFSFATACNMKAAPACGHFFCDSCWTGYIHTAISDGPGCLTLRCADPSCGCAIGEDMVHALVASPDERRKYTRFLLRSFVEDNRRAKWCPAPGCEYAVLGLAPGAPGAGDVQCKCSFRFCWHCSEEAHRPVDCDTVGKWLGDLKVNGESENINWILANSQLCPKCKRPIEKNQGCMHMTCTPPCKFEFCWLCLGDWRDHACNRYGAGGGLGAMREDSEAYRRRDMAKSSVDRYTHYYERWATNETSRAKAQADLRQMEAVHLARLSDVQSQPVSQLKFVAGAWRQIVECRRVLKWTYAYGFYLPDAERAKRQFFEYLQAEAEAALERLHRCAATDLLVFLDLDDPALFNDFRIRLQGLTHVTRSYFENLVKALESGLTDVVPARLPDAAAVAVADDDDEGVSI
ncbi:ariadne-1 [Marchantia polymorpha subsp. ruderalis]|nr:hypothetical protein MARPO_0148s0018 [Marchantia polymorpha]BBN09086.1 hypothetical protein Mp_4g17020 [Marchantia polymorpha subsp. ruderalis]|eukprot:PTQ29068.1 hypothetical protein MARPO_0148s0018 [Marchantia polymorpha]